MSAYAKLKLAQGSSQSRAPLLDQLGELFARPNITRSAQQVSATMLQSLRELQHRMSAAELITLRDVMRELATQIDQLVPADDNQALPPSGQSQSLKKAQQEDAAAENALDLARRRSGAMSTLASVREGKQALARAEQHAVTSVMARIANHELLSSAELQRALNVKRQAISGAVKAGRLFALVGPSGDNYYPSFYADPTLDRRIVEKVTKALGALPAASKYHFLTAKSTWLNATPLDALRNGRVDDVLAAAAGFAQR